MTDRTDPEAAAPPPVRAAATLIVCRRLGGQTRVLMGQRGAKAAFMASKYVFPGGAVDPADAAQGGDALSRILPPCAARLAQHCPASAPAPGTLVAAGLRELAEETGLTLPPGAPPLTFVFRAITPPGRGRRFDARFFLADGDALCGDAEAFSGASDELSHLHWIGLAEARALDLPFITEVVLAEVQARLNGAPDRGVPFFDNSTDRPAFRRLV